MLSLVLHHPWPIGFVPFFQDCPTGDIFATQDSFVLKLVHPPIFMQSAILQRPFPGVSVFLHLTRVVPIIPSHYPCLGVCSVQIRVHFLCKRFRGWSQLLHIMIQLPSSYPLFCISLCTPLQIHISHLHFTFTILETSYSASIGTSCDQVLFCKFNRVWGWARGSVDVPQGSFSLNLYKFEQGGIN